LHPDDLQPTLTAWQHSIQTGNIYQIEHRVRMAGGSYRWHLSRGVPILDDNGQVSRWFGTATDIHDLKLAEEQLKVYAGRLESSNRELEQFALMASHDLQEPLREIERFVALLRGSAAALDEHQRSYLDRIQNAARQMRDMADGVLQPSRAATLPAYRPGNPQDEPGETGSKEE
jgi:signal transduction histidine kinase